MIATLPEQLNTLVERREDKVSVLVRDDTAVDPLDQMHGFLLTPSQALATAEELMAKAGQIVGEDEAITIFAESLAGGTGTLDDEPIHMVVATDREGRTIRLAFRDEALRQLGTQIYRMLGQDEPETRH